MGKIHSVLGPIDAEDLGFTLMHEHILFASWSMRQAFDHWLDVDKLIEKAAAELRAARQLGEAGVSDRDIHAMTAANPARVFSA